MVADWSWRRETKLLLSFAPLLLNICPTVWLLRSPLSISCYVGIRGQTMYVVVGTPPIESKIWNYPPCRKFWLVGRTPPCSRERAKRASGKFLGFYVVKKNLWTTTPSLKIFFEPYPPPRKILTCRWLPPLYRKIVCPRMSGSLRSHKNLIFKSYTPPSGHLLNN